MNIGFALCGSFCTFGSVFPVMRQLAQSHDVYPIFSFSAASIDTRFGNAADFIADARRITGRSVWSTIADVEPISPRRLLDLLVIAPCTGNTLAKLSRSIADTPVTMAAKSILRNGRPVVVAGSTNDGLSGAAENIGRLLSKKHYFFVPFGQDNAQTKPCSLVAHFDQIPAAVQAASEGRQLQPLLQ